MIFSMISFLEKVITKTCSVLKTIQLLVTQKNVFSLLGQMYKLAFFSYDTQKRR